MVEVDPAGEKVGAPRSLYVCNSYADAVREPLAKDLAAAIPLDEADQVRKLLRTDGIGVKERFVVIIGYVVKFVRIRPPTAEKPVTVVYRRSQQVQLPIC
jgi:hypothetical protein